MTINSSAPPESRAEKIARLEKRRQELIAQQWALNNPVNYRKLPNDKMAEFMWNHVCRYARTCLELPTEEAVQAAATCLLVIDAIAVAEHGNKPIKNFEMRHPAVMEMVVMSCHGKATDAGRVALERFGSRLLLKPQWGHEPGIRVMLTNENWQEISEQRKLIRWNIEKPCLDHTQFRGKLVVTSPYFGVLLREGLRQASGERACFRRLIPVVRFHGTFDSWQQLHHDSL